MPLVFKPFHRYPVGTNLGKIGTNVLDPAPLKGWEKYSSFL